MKPPSILTTIFRYLKQRKLNQTREDIAELTELVRVRGLFFDSNPSGVSTYLITQYGEWSGQLAGLLARRDRLEKELGLVKTSN